METTTRTIEDLLSVQAVRQLTELVGDREDTTVALQQRDGTMLWASEPGAVSMFKRRLQQFSGVHSEDFIHPESLASYRRALDRARDGETAQWTGLVSAGDGTEVRVTAVMWLVEDHKQAPMILSVTAPAAATGAEA